MTSDNLLKFLGTREYLYQVSYQELKSMVVQYPYSLSLRYLLAMKSQQEDNTDQSRNIELLATYGIDRTHLYHIFNEKPISLEELEESVLLGEDFLELKELSSLERELDEKVMVNDASGITFIEEAGSKEIDNDTNQIIEEVQKNAPSTIKPNPEVDLLMKEKFSETTVEEQSEIEAEELSGEAPILKESSADQEDEFITLGFEEETIGEAVGSTESKSDLIPSESYINDIIEFDENGLPPDAVEVNDLFNNQIESPRVESLENLFLDEEQAATSAESDSSPFIENPGEVLDEESLLALQNQETSQYGQHSEPEEDKGATLTPASNSKLAIPFEIIHADKDPISPLDFEEEEVEIPKSTIEIQVPNIADNINETTPLIEEDKEMPELATEIQETSSLKEETAQIQTYPPESINKEIKFENLDRFEEKFSREKLIKIKSPLAKVNFTSWQEQFSGLRALSGMNLSLVNNANLEGKVIRKPRKTIRKKFQKTVAFAEESLQSNDDIASETLAQLLVEQGHYDKAKTMYEELSLILPEKSVFFAGEIEKIENLKQEDS